jgi:hypothetical protein
MQPLLLWKSSITQPECVFLLIPTNALFHFNAYSVLVFKMHKIFEKPHSYMFRSTSDHHQGATCT